MAQRKRFLAILLSVFMLIQALPMNALASEWTVGATDTSQGAAYYEVTFSVDGSQIAKQLFEAGANAAIPSVPEEPSKEGYTFEGWFDGETEITAGTVVTGDVDAEAVFAPIDIFTVTIKYVTADGAEVADSVVRQYKKGDEAETVESPASVSTGSGYLFPDQGSVTIDPSQLTGDQEIRVTYTAANGSYSVVHMLKDLDGEGYTEIEREILNGVIGATVLPESKEYDYAEFEKADTAVIAGASGTSVNVYYTRRNFTLSYDSQGGSYVAPVIGRYGETVRVQTNITVTCSLEEHTHVNGRDGCGYNFRTGTYNCGKTAHTHSSSCQYSSSTPVAVREGYTFTGWYTDAACTTKAGETAVLNGNVTVYAGWAPAMANYTIVYWGENIDGGWNYLESAIGSAQVGTTVSAGAKSGGWNNFDDSQYYEYDGSLSTSAVVKADGSTVVEAYYKLKVYTLRFDISESTGVTLNVDGKTINSQRNSGNSRTYEYSFTARLGEDISTKWPTAGNISGNKTAFYGWDYGGSSDQVSKILVLSKELINAGGNDGVTDCKAIYQGGTTVYLHYMLQNVNDDGYTEMEEYSQYAVTSSGDFGQKQIAGYEAEESKKQTKTVSGVKHFYFYYNRAEYAIDYYSGTTLLDTISGIRYGKNINSSTYNWTPTAAQAGVDSALTFGGWYSNPQCTEKYDFTTMPASNVVVYAKWITPDRYVTLVYNNGDDNGSVTVKLGDSVGSLPTPVREGYTFTGWYSDAAGGVQFDVNQPIMINTTVYAHWRMNDLGYTVHYYKKGTTESVYPDKKVSSAVFTVGQKVYENSVAVTGYRVDAAQKTATLQPGTNEIIFYYTVRGAVDYTVHYLEQGTNKTVKASSTVTVGAQTERVVVYAPEISGYYAVNKIESLSLTADESANVITFYYLPYGITSITVKYEDAQGNAIADDATASIIIGDSFQAEKKAIDGYAFSHYEGDDDGYIVAVADASVIITLVYKKSLTINIVGNTKTVTYNGSEQSVEGFTHNAPAGVTVSLKSGSEAKASGTEVGTYNMGLTEDHFTISGADSYGQVTLNVTDGWLKINPIDGLEVVITGNTKTVTYNGSEQSVEGFTHNAPAGVTVSLKSGSEAKASGTEVGTYNMGLTEADFDVTSDSYTNITVTVVDGWLKIEPIKETTVTIKGNTDTKVYNGSEQSVTGYTVEGPSDVTVALKDDYEAIAKGTNVGEYPMGLTEAHFSVSSDHYDKINVIVVDGKLTITPADEAVVKVQGNSDTVTYNGSEQSVTGYTVIENTIGATIELVGEAVAKGTNVGEYPMGLTEDDFTASHPNYTKVTVMVTDGKLTITPADEAVVKVQGNSDTVTYNGSEQSVTGYTVIENTIGATIELVGEAVAKGTNVGEYPMGLTEADFTASHPNYTKVNVIVVDGKLTITPADEAVVKVQGNSDTKTYNGSEQSVSGYTVIENTIGATIELVGEAVAKGTNVGEYPMGLTEADFTASHPNYTKVNVVVVDGWLKITPIVGHEVVIKGNTDTKVYNGSEQSVTGFTTEGTNSEIVVSAKNPAAIIAKGTDVGRYPMNLTKDMFNVQHSANYEGVKVTVIDGGLTITPVDALTVLVTGNTGTYTYDGSNKTVSGYKATLADGSALPADVTVAISDEALASVTAKNAGSYPMGLKEEYFIAESVNYSAITVQVVDGWLKINPVDGHEIVINGNTATKVYNGSVQSVTGYTVEGGNDEITVALKSGSEAKASGTEVGTYDMGLTKADFNVSATGNYTNVKVTVNDGWLKITPAGVLEVTVRGNTGAYTYDGTAKTVSGYTEEIPAGETVTITMVSGEARVSGVNVGQYPMGLTAANFTAVSPNHDSVVVNVVDGWLKINPADVLDVYVTGNTGVYTYDGTTKTVSGYKAVLADGSELPAHVTLSCSDEARVSGVNAGDYPMGLSESDFTASSANYSQVKVHVTDGWLKINPAGTLTVTITGNSKTEKYDGAEKSVTGYKHDAPADVTVRLNDGIEAVAKGVNVGEYPMGLDASDFTVSSDNYSSINVVVVDGKLTITPADALVIDIVGKTKVVVYNGFTQKVTGYTVSGAPADVTVALKSGSSATAIGTNVGRYLMGLDADDFEVTAPNYSSVTVNVKDGWLRIIPISKALVITADSNSKVYDGTALTDDGYTWTEGVLVSGHEIVAVVEGSATNVGDEGQNVVASYKVVNASGRDVTGNYSGITTEDGKLTILPKDVTITVDDASKRYQQPDPAFTGSVEGLVNGDDLNVEYYRSNSDEYVGEYPDVLDATYTENANYTVTVIEGDFTITGDPAEVEKDEVNVQSNYELGEAISFEITVENISNYPLTDVRVTDSSAEIVSGSGYTVSGNVATIASIPVGGSVVVKAQHRVTEADILAGTYHNVATVTVEDKSLTADETVDNIDDVDTTLIVEKISETAENVKLGQSVEYSIKVTNAGNVTYSNVVVKDDLTGEQWTIKSLAVGASETFTTEYVVTEADLLSGSIVNVATAKGDPVEDPRTPDQPKIPEGEDDETVETEEPAPGVSVRKSSDKPEGYQAELGDVITYTITVTNTGNLTIENLEVRDDLVSLSKTIASLAPGESKSYTASYTVTSADILSGSVVNVATAKGSTPGGPVEDEDTETVETEEVDTTLKVTKTSDVAEGETVGLGETITYRIVVKNAGNVPFTNVKVIDELEGASIQSGAGYSVEDGKAVISHMAVGASVTIIATYTVTEADILNGEVVNVVTAKGESGDPDEDPEGGDEETDETDDIDTTLIVEKISETAGAVKLGETIEYSIKVTNAGNVTYYDVVVTDELTGDEWTIESLAVGASESFTAEYVVTEADILAGSVLNVATAKGDEVEDPKNPDEPKIPEGEDDEEDETEEPNPALDVVKTTVSTPANGETYALGETIRYRITVTNTGNLTASDVVVSDELTGDEWTVESLAVGASESFDAEYVVTEADVLNGKVVNAATAKGSTPDGGEPTDEDKEEDETDDVDTTLIVEKTALTRPVNGTSYALGEKVGYRIDVTNNGNVTFYNVDVTDPLTGAHWSIPALAVGETCNFLTVYVITEDDILNGHVLNVATAAGDPVEDPKNPDEPKIPEGEDDEDVPTDSPNPSLFVKKITTSAPANGATYALGEEIEYEVTVTNNGNMTLENVVVTDELTGDEWTVGTLTPGQSSQVFETSYVVTEADILAGSVINVATADGDSPDGEEPTVIPGETEDPTDEPNPSLNVVKTLTNLPQKGYFTVGEVAEFDITVTNDGNLTLTNVTVAEQLEDAVFAEGEGYAADGAAATVDVLVPGESITLKAVYTVKLEDLGTELVNVVVASGDGPTDPDPETDEEEVPTDDLTEAAGSKTWTDLENQFGTRPEAITLRLMADGVEIKAMTVDASTDWTYVFDMLPVHTVDGDEIAYTVVEDAVAGYDAIYAEESNDITNSLQSYTLTIRYWYNRVDGREAAPTVTRTCYYGESYDVASPRITGYRPDAESVAGVITADVVYDVIYTARSYDLTIYYVYQDGTVAAPTYTDTLKYREDYFVASPELEGYVPSIAAVAGEMPARDVEVTVIYVPETTEIVIDEYGVPLGIGNVEMNVGDCFE